MLNPEMVEKMLNDPQVRAGMAEKPTPFAPVPVEVAERRLHQCRQLIGVYADTMQVHLETNPVEEHESYMGEGLINAGLSEMTDAMKSALTGALMQSRISGAEIVTALDGFEFLMANVDECITLAHEEVVATVEARLGRAIADVRKAANETSRNDRRRPEVEA